MDYEEWELISGDGFLSLVDEETNWRCESLSVLDTNYFESPSNSRIKVLPIQLPQKQTEVQVVAVADQEPAVSQVFFKKITKEQQPEFAEIKMESLTSSPTRGFVPRLRSEAKDIESELVENEIENENNSNLWKLSLTGLGAICSFAAICILFFGTQNRSSQRHNKIAFNIYDHDHKKHGSKLSDVMSGVRGVGMSRAQVTYGGFYEAL